MVTITVASLPKERKENEPRDLGPLGFVTMVTQGHSQRPGWGASGLGSPQVYSQV